MNLNDIDEALIGALPWLAATVFPVLLVCAAVFGTEWYRLGDENVHDVADYHPMPGSRLIDVGDRRRLRRPVSETPIADEVAALPMSDETAHAVARQWLEEIAAEQHAKTGDLIWHRATDRDMTGAFPVVAVS